MTGGVCLCNGDKLISFVIMRPGMRLGVRRTTDLFLGKITTVWAWVDARGLRALEWRRRNMDQCRCEVKGC